MSDRITRAFQVKRGKAQLEYLLETYSIIFEKNIFEKKSNYEKLQWYIRKVFMEGYPEREGKMSVSQMKPLVLQSSCVDNPITSIIRAADYYGHGNDQHSIVQKHLLDKDPSTLVVELPVWDDEMHGFIDVVRCLPHDKINIFDFKPNAIKETKAASQVKRYAHLLSRRTGISLDDIVCSYGDGSHYFQLN